MTAWVVQRLIDAALALIDLIMATVGRTVRT